MIQNKYKLVTILFTHFYMLESFWKCILTSFLKGKREKGYFIVIIYMKKYLIVASIVSYLVAILLLIHHAYKHSLSGEEPLYGMDEYFQISDVGNYRTFNHETFVILFVIIGSVLLYKYCI